MYIIGRAGTSPPSCTTGKEMFYIRLVTKVQRRERLVLHFNELEIDNRRGNVVLLKLPFKEKLD